MSNIIGKNIKYVDIKTYDNQGKAITHGVFYSIVDGAEVSPAA